MSNRQGTGAHRSHHLTRRRLLGAAGLGGLTMALPPLEALGQTAQKKLVIFHLSNGAPLEHWNNLALPREALGDMLGKCTVVRGSSQRQLVDPLLAAGVNGHCAGLITLLTSRPATPDPGDRSEPGHQYKATGESCDEVAGRYINGGRPVRSWAAETRGVSKQQVLSYTASGARFPLTATWEMMRAFDGIARSGATDALAGSRRKRVMQSLKRQADVVNKQLGAEDRIRLDQYLTSISQLENSLAAADATSGTAATPMKGCPPVLATNTFPTTGINMNHVNNVFELSFRALQCGVTNVLVLQVIASGAGPTLTSMGITGGVDVTRDHDPSHWKGNTTNWKELYRQSTLWKTKRFAEFLRKLNSEPGPDGKTVLDNAAVLCLSEMGEGSEHSPANIVTIAAGGAFKKPSSDAIDANVPLANVLLTAMRAVGITESQMPKWGNSTGTIGALV